MEKEEIANVLDILKKARKAVREQDSFRLKELSNHTLHSASIYQDMESVMTAVIVYSLSKIIERKGTNDFKEWDKFISGYLVCIDKSIKSLENNDVEGFKNCLAKIREEMGSLGKDFREYVQEVFRKASINKASKIYEHGISMEQTAKLLGITIWELQEYAGQTRISEEMTKTIPVKERIKLAMDLFK